MMLDRTTPRWVNIYTYNGETFPGAAFWHSRENAIIQAIRITRKRGWKLAYRLKITRKAAA